MLIRLMAIVGSSLLVGCSVFGVRSGYEEPPYEVLDTLRDDLEIRRYQERLAAEVTVESEDRDAAMNDGFRILAGFIFGGNQSSESIEMTAPVEVEAESERIAMTMPVETLSADGGLVMRFFMPSRFTRETLPTPTDERIRIVDVPGETLAVLRFSGLGRTSSVETHESELDALLGASSWRADGTPVAYYYDPPWTLPFLRRNEIAVPVVR